MTQLCQLPEKGNVPIILPMNIIDTDVLIGRNLKRIREKHGLSQAQLAELIGTTPQRLSAYETGRDGMGKAYMERVCRALKVQSWEFYWTEDAPIIKDEYERAALDRFRREQAAGVAEDSAKYGEYLIERAKSSTSDIDARVRRGQEILKKGRQKKSA